MGDSELSSLVHTERACEHGPSWLSKSYELGPNAVLCPQHHTAFLVSLHPFSNRMLKRSRHSEILAKEGDPGKAVADGDGPDH